MKRIFLVIVLMITGITTVEADELQDHLSFNTKYFLASARRLGNDFYYELSYNKHISNKIFIDTGIGYASLEAEDVALTIKKELQFIPLHLGLKYQIFKYLSVKGGVTYNYFHLDCVDIPSEIGGYFGIEIGTNIKNNLDIYLDLGQQFGDMDVNYPILEDGTNVNGWMLGGGLKYKF